METLYDKLKKYSEGRMYGYHMPGHKRNQSLYLNELPYHLDLTEIDGFDNLHRPEGILLEAQKRAARLFGAKESYYLVGGSTAGLLSGILGTVKQGEELIVGPDCHKAVFHGIALGKAQGVYLDDEEHCRENGQETAALSDGILNLQRRFDDTLPKRIQKALREHPRAKGVLITSPTYEGFLADIPRIAGIVHDANGVLIVDQAHGAHLGFHEYFGDNANRQGADIVIQSLHKTLPALTQTALLHVNGSRELSEAVKEKLHMLQTSSPSYVLMASIDECVCLLQTRGKELFAEYVKNLSRVREALGNLQTISLVETARYDRSKLVLCPRRGTPKLLYQLLRLEYQIQPELMGVDYVLLMTSVADTKQGFDRLILALQDIDQRFLAGERFALENCCQDVKRQTKEMCYKSFLEGEKK